MKIPAFMDRAFRWGGRAPVIVDRFLGFIAAHQGLRQDLAAGFGQSMLIFHDLKNDHKDFAQLIYLEQVMPAHDDITENGGYIFLNGRAP